MRKIWTILLTISLFVFSCKKDEISTDFDLQLQEKINWDTEDFKTLQTIQFPPDNYEGDGMKGFEGNVFSKNRMDESVEMSYSFCGPLYCTDYGDKLPSAEPGTITITVNDVDITLDKKASFYDDTERMGIFYYSTPSERYGKLYWKDQNAFKEALDVHYMQIRHDEVLNIISTIKTTE